MEGNVYISNALTIKELTEDMDECMGSCLSYNENTDTVCRLFNVMHDGSFCNLKNKKPGDDGVELLTGNWWGMRRPDWYLGECSVSLQLQTLNYCLRLKS